MEYIRVTKDNLEEEHICCAISNNKDVQVSSKKAWLVKSVFIWPLIQFTAQKLSKQSVSTVRKSSF